MYKLDHFKGEISTIISWIFTISLYNIKDVNIFLSTISTVFAIVASIYAIKVHHKNLKKK